MFAPNVANLCVLQAIRLVKNSIIAIESPEAEVDDVDYVDDLEEVEDVLERYKKAEGQASAQRDEGKPLSYNNQLLPIKFIGLQNVGIQQIFLRIILP